MTGKPRRALLDTSVVITPPTVEQVTGHADELAVSVMTLAELQYGITAASDPVEQIHRRQRVAHALARFEVLSFDVPTAEYYGALCALVRQRGRNPRPRRMDLLIAATAARHNLALLTRNGADFAGLASALTIVDLHAPGTP